MPKTRYEYCKESTKRYLEKFNAMTLRFPKGMKDTIKAHAESRGESVNAFVTRAINETIDRDNESRTD